MNSEHDLYGIRTASTHSSLISVFLCELATSFAYDNCFVTGFYSEQHLGASLAAPIDT